VKKDQFRKYGKMFVNRTELISYVIQLEAFVAKLLISDECQINRRVYKNRFQVFFGWSSSYIKMAKIYDWLVCRMYKILQFTRKVIHF
jgi:hypothetical protein